MILTGDIDARDSGKYLRPGTHKTGASRMVRALTDDGGASETSYGQRGTEPQPSEDVKGHSPSADRVPDGMHAYPHTHLAAARFGAIAIAAGRVVD
jgi:hypothetical protein